jgi:hypothetical protein
VSACTRRLSVETGEGHDVGRSPRNSLRTGKPPTWRRGVGDRGVSKPGERSVYTESRAVMVLNPNVPKNALSGVAEVCRDLWRAECVTKGACSVRGGAMGNRWLRDPTAPVVYSTH